MTINTLIQQLTGRLKDKVDDAYTDTQVLLCYALNVNRAWLIAHSDDRINETEMETVNTIFQRREAGEPVAYITGYKEFWSHRFKVTADTLIPRPETEHLIEQILLLGLPGTDVNLLDFGTGSGVIAIALAKERPGWHITAMDTSTKALAVARENAEIIGADNINFAEGDNLNTLVDNKFTVIVSNPPYIKTDDPHLQQGDVRFEPNIALISGEDGLDCIRTLVAQAPDHLKPDGYLMMEHGFEQGDDVRKLLNQHDYTDIRTVPDLSGNERITMARYDTQ